MPFTPPCQKSISRLPPMRGNKDDMIELSVKENNVVIETITIRHFAYWDNVIINLFKGMPTLSL